MLKVDNYIDITKLNYLLQNYTSDSEYFNAVKDKFEAHQLYKCSILDYVTYYHIDKSKYLSTLKAIINEYFELIDFKDSKFIDNTEELIYTNADINSMIFTAYQDYDIRVEIKAIFDNIYTSRYKQVKETHYENYIYNDPNYSDIKEIKDYSKEYTTESIEYYKALVYRVDDMSEILTLNELILIDLISLHTRRSKLLKKEIQSFFEKYLDNVDNYNFCYASVKKRTRCMEKVVEYLKEHKDGTKLVVGDLKDISRCSLSFDTFAETKGFVDFVLNASEQEDCTFSIIEVKNKFRDESSRYAYKDIKLIMLHKTSGLLLEVQLIQSMIVEMKKIDHKFYEVSRANYSHVEEVLSKDTKMSKFLSQLIPKCKVDYTISLTNKNKVVIKHNVLGMHLIKSYKLSDGIKNISFNYYTNKGAIAYGNKIRIFDYNNYEYTKTRMSDEVMKIKVHNNLLAIITKYELIIMTMSDSKIKYSQKISNYIPIDILTDDINTQTKLVILYEEKLTIFNIDNIDVEENDNYSLSQVFEYEINNKNAINIVKADKDYMISTTKPVLIFVNKETFRSVEIDIRHNINNVYYSFINKLLYAIDQNYLHVYSKNEDTLSPIKIYNNQIKINEIKISASGSFLILHDTSHKVSIISTCMYIILDTISMNYDISCLKIGFKDEFLIIATSNNQMHYFSLNKYKYTMEIVEKSPVYSVVVSKDSSQIIIVGNDIIMYYGTNFCKKLNLFETETKDLRTLTLMHKYLYPHCCTYTSNDRFIIFHYYNRLFIQPTLKYLISRKTIDLDNKIQSTSIIPCKIYDYEDKSDRIIIYTKNHVYFYEIDQLYYEGKVENDYDLSKYITKEEVHDITNITSNMKRIVLLNKDNQITLYNWDFELIYEESLGMNSKNIYMENKFLVVVSDDNHVLVKDTYYQFSYKSITSFVTGDGFGYNVFEGKMDYDVEYIDIDDYERVLYLSGSDHEFKSYAF